MSELRPRTLQIIWLLVAAMLLTGAAMVHGPMDQMGRQYELAPAGQAAMAKHPELALVQMAPGGLRALVINYFWMRSQDLHRQGRHFDAMQLAEIICTLQPRFPGVWEFQSWQLAWNISATADTGPERWRWVRTGIELLRDRGIPMNPKSLGLYKQLSWTFISKMGDNTDEKHAYYKQIWARDMQNLLGAPQVADSQTLIAAFEPIADALVDKNEYRPRSDKIQADKRRELLQNNPDVAALAIELHGVGLAIDESLLEAYNFCTPDDAVDLTRLESTQNRDIRLRMYANSIKDEIEQTRRLDEIDRKAQWAAVVNNPDHAEAMGKALAFIRAQILWGRYKMDPAYMYKLMKKYGPLDWRVVWSHGLYWSAYGSEHCDDVDPGHIDNLNLDRTFLSSLKNLAWQGRIDYFQPNRRTGSQEAMPDIGFRSDWRFVQATHEEYIRLGELWATRKSEKFADNPLKDGHINFLANAIAALHVRGRKVEAQKYFKWVKANTELTKGQSWAVDNVDEFVVATLTNQEYLVPRVVTSQITAALQTAMIWVARGDRQASDEHIAYAQRLHVAYHKRPNSMTDRLRMPKLDIMAARIFGGLLVRPKMLDVDLSLAERSLMYRAMELRWPKMVAALYDPVHRSLLQQCQDEKLDFEKLFPPPRLLNEARRQRAARSRRQ
jgi:hypothetical protein